MKLISTVFEVAPEDAAAFRAAVFANANAVERGAAGCRGVAIAEDPSAPGFFLTSALYADETAASNGIDAQRDFEETVARLVKQKRVQLVDIS